MVAYNFTSPSLSGRVAVLIGELGRATRTINAAISELDRLSSELKTDRTSALTAWEYKDAVMKLLARGVTDPAEVTFVSKLVAQAFGYGVEPLACAAMASRCLESAREVS